MAAEQTMNHMIMQAATETAKVVKMEVRDVANLINNARPVHAMPRQSGTTLRLANV